MASPNKSIEDRCFRTKQLMAYVGISRTTLHVWRKRKQKPFPAPIELTSRVKVWRRSEIDAWLASHRRAAA